MLKKESEATNTAIGDVSNILRKSISARRGKAYATKFLKIESNIKNKDKAVKIEISMMKTNYR